MNMTRDAKNDSKQLSFDFDMRKKTIEFKNNVVHIQAFIKSRQVDQKNKVIDRLLLEARKIKW